MILHIIGTWVLAHSQYIHNSILLLRTIFFHGRHEENIKIFFELRYKNIQYFILKMNSYCKCNALVLLHPSYEEFK
jgi:hypothetical protein